MSGYIVRNLLMTDEPQFGPPPVVAGRPVLPNVLAMPAGDWRDTVAPQPTQADAADATAKAYTEWQARDRQRQIDLGYVDPQTGALTPEGWRAQAQTVAGGFGPADIGAMGIIRSTTGPSYSLQRLHPRMMTPITNPMGSGSGEHVFAIRNPAGEDQGLIGTKWTPETGELHVRGIESNEGPNTLGLSAISQLRAALLELYPGVKTLTGHRISGAGPGRDAAQNLENLQ